MYYVPKTGLYFLIVLSIGMSLSMHVYPSFTSRTREVNTHFSTGQRLERAQKQEKTLRGLWIVSLVGGALWMAYAMTHDHSVGSELAGLICPVGVGFVLARHAQKTLTLEDLVKKGQPEDKKGW